MSCDWGKFLETKHCRLVPLGLQQKVSVLASFAFLNRLRKFYFFCFLGQSRQPRSTLPPINDWRCSPRTERHEVACLMPSGYAWNSQV